MPRNWPLTAGVRPTASTSPPGFEHLGHAEADPGAVEVARSRRSWCRRSRCRRCRRLRPSAPRHPGRTSRRRPARGQRSARGRQRERAVDEAAIGGSDEGLLTAISCRGLERGAYPRSVTLASTPCRHGQLSRARLRALWPGSPGLRAGHCRPGSGGRGRSSRSVRPRRRRRHGSARPCPGRAARRPRAA